MGEEPQQQSFAGFDILNPVKSGKDESQQRPVRLFPNSWMWGANQLAAKRKSFGFLCQHVDILMAMLSWEYITSPAPIWPHKETLSMPHCIPSNPITPHAMVPHLKGKYWRRFIFQVQQPPKKQEDDIVYYCYYCPDVDCRAPTYEAFWNALRLAIWLNVPGDPEVSAPGKQCDYFISELLKPKAERAASNLFYIWIIKTKSRTGGQ
jgi:hypothetical protein